MEESDAIVLGGLSAAYYIIRNIHKRRRSRRSIWMREYFKKRNFGILKDLEANDSVLFKNFTRMSKKNFDTLLEMVRPQIEKPDSNFREAIPADITLAITLRFLATGDSFLSLMYLFRVSKQFISSTIPVVLKAIIGSLKGHIKVIYLKH
jgi:hypothetical protein